MTKNLTTGNPALLIFTFAVPLFIGNLFQQFYNMADTFIVGRTLGVQALAAVGCTGSINFFIVGFLMGFTSGAAIITAQRFGANDIAGVRRSFAVSIFLSAVMCVVFMLIAVPGARLFLRLLRTPPEIIDQAYQYLHVIFWGLPATMLFNLLSNTMRAVGDSRTPLYFLVVACLINIALDYAFILVLHTGVEGAAMATIIAQLISGLLCIPVILKKLPVLIIRREDWRFGWKDVWEQIRVALPVGFQMSIIAIGALSVTFALNGLGSLSVAAFTAAQKIDQLATLPLNSFGAAITTYAAQNYGARKYDRIRQGVKQCAWMSCSWAVFMGILYFVLGRTFAMIFLGPGEDAAADLAQRYLRINGVFYFALAVLFDFRQTMQGMGDSFTPTLSGIIELFMRAFAAIILAHFGGYTGVCFANTFAWIGACVWLSIAMRRTMKRLRREELRVSRQGRT